MINAKVRDRIRKLMTLGEAGKDATSDEVRTEAETALRMAHALMREHGLTDTRVAFTTQEDGAPGVSVSPKDISEGEAFVGSITRWDRRIANTCARAFGAETYYVPGERVCIYGLPADVAVASEVAVAMKRAMSKSLRRWLRERRARGEAIESSGVKARSFRDGFCDGLSLVVDAAERELNGDASTVQVREAGTGHALVVRSEALVAAKEAALAEWTNARGFAKARRSTVSREVGSYAAGHAAGSQQVVSRAALAGKGAPA